MSERGIPFFPFRERNQPSSPEQQLRALSDDLVTFLRITYAMEGERRNFLDFDLAPNPVPGSRLISKYILSAPTQREWRTILEDLEESRLKVEDLVPPKNPRERLQYEFLIAKLRAHQVFYQTKTNGQLPPLDFIEMTMNKTPELLDESKIMAQKEIVERLFVELGCRSYDRQSIEEFQLTQLVPTETVPYEISKYAVDFLKTLSNFIGKKISPSFDIVVVQADEYWINWASGNRNQLTLKVNTHSRHSRRWTKGKIEAMTCHEVLAHFGQAESWGNAIDKGDLLPVLGLTSVHDPEQVTCEGIAQTIHLFVPELRQHLSAKGELELECEGLRQMIYNNIHIMVNTQEVSDADMIEYVRRFYPAEPEEEIKRQIDDRKDNPVNRTYMYAYGIGFALHQWYAANLNPRGKRKLLEFIFSQPTTPKQEFEFVIQLLGDPSQSYGSLRVDWDNSGNPLPIFN